MLDTINSSLTVIDDGGSSGNLIDDQNFTRLIQNIGQRRHLLKLLTLLGTAVGCAAGLAYIVFRVSAFSASSEILISNTTLQLSGRDAVVSQVPAENSLVENALELLKSSKVLGRVVDKIGSEEIELISPRSHVWPWSVSYWESRSSGETGNQASISLLRANTVVKRIGSSQIVSIDARALTATDSARLANEIAGAFVQEEYEANAIVSTSAALRERIKVLGPTARIISEAAPPKGKDTLRAAVVMLLGIMLGSGLGGGGGLLLIGLDRRLRAAEQIAAVTPVECFGYAPRVNHSEAKIGISFLPGARRADRARGGRSEHASKRCVPSKSRNVTAPLRSLLRKVSMFERLLSPAVSGNQIDMDCILGRSVWRHVRSIMRERLTSEPHIVGVTSCETGEGKSTLAASLARFLAREGTPVLLIDASSAEKSGGQAQGQNPGLHELLLGKTDMTRAIQSDICRNLDFLPRGKGSGDLDLLWGDFLHAVSGGRGSSYKWIILVLPSLATGVDVRSAGQVVDDLLVVVEWGRITQGKLQQGLRALGNLQERVIGTVINKAPWECLDPETASYAGPAAADQSETIGNCAQQGQP